MSERKSFKQMVMDNFTGEFNTWDELMNVFDDELAKAKQEAEFKRTIAICQFILKLKHQSMETYADRECVVHNIELKFLNKENLKEVDKKCLNRNALLQ